MKLVAGLSFYPLPEIGRPYGWKLEGTIYEMREVSLKLLWRLPREPDLVKLGYPAYWCNCRDGRFLVYPTPHDDLELITLPLPDPAKLAAFVAQEIGA